MNTALVMPRESISVCKTLCFCPFDMRCLYEPFNSMRVSGFKEECIWPGVERCQHRDWKVGLVSLQMLTTRQVIADLELRELTFKQVKSYVAV